MFTILFLAGAIFVGIFTWRDKNLVTAAKRSLVISLSGVLLDLVLFGGLFAYVYIQL